MPTFSGDTSHFGFDDPLAARGYWIAQLVSEGARATATTVRHIRDLRPMEELLALLHDSEERTRAVGTAMLWNIWLGEAGADAERDVQRGLRLMGQDRLDEAEALFTDLIDRSPDFAEAYNKRATVRFLAGMYDAAVADCEDTLQRNPAHFGAWHGLGLCQEARGAYGEAADAFAHALALQPYAAENQARLTACRVRLRGEEDA